MACYAALSEILGMLKDIIHRDRYPEMLLGRQHVLTSLFEKFHSVHELWEDYGSKGDEAVNDHAERQIKDVADQALDVIQFEIWHKKDSESGGAHLVVRNNHHPISTCQNALVRPDECEEKLRKVEKQVDFIVEGLMAIKESQTSEDLQLSDYPSACVGAFHPTPIPTDDIFVGLDEFKKRIFDRLFGGLNNLEIITIMGTGGIGKTTLARNIFHDPRVQCHFHYVAWVTISRTDRMENISRKILESILGISVVNEIIFGEYENFATRLYSILQRRSYLIVIDDVYSKAILNYLIHFLPDYDRGSRIVITTQLSKLATHVRMLMPFLNEDESWDLLQQKVFGQELCPPNLENIGKFIASKCEGLPLAIVEIAGILSNIAKKPQSWEIIARDMDSILCTDDGDLSKVFSRSYNNLSRHLKPCYLYMGSFPRDYEINVSKLIRLWIAEGFLKSIDGSKTLTQVAEDCLKDLVQRNLVIVTRKRVNGDFKFCKLHRCFCRQRAEYEDYFHVMDTEGHKFPRGDDEPHEHNFVKPMRSILWFDETFGSNFESVELDNLKLLRVLGIRTTLPITEAILKMFYLKYLELYLEDLRPGACLSPSIYALQNLQTLIISSSSSYSIILPLEIWKMTQLNHLIIDAMILPPISTVSGIPVQKLESLETLMTVENFIFTNDAIEMIPNLRKLKIKCTRNEGNSIWELYSLDNLVRLCLLEDLKISVGAARFSGHGSVWSSFIFPPKLRKLSLEGCQSSWDDMIVVAGLPNLQELSLRENSFAGEEWRTRKGGFSQLKFLLMERLDLKYWRAEEQHFPSLQHLIINECYELEKIPLDFKYISTLEFIDVFKSNGATNSARPILEWRQQFVEYTLQVRIID